MTCFVRAEFAKTRIRPNPDRDLCNPRTSVFQRLLNRVRATTRDDHTRSADKKDRTDITVSTPRRVNFTRRWPF